MCWNAEVSLNTFLFSSFILCLIMYNNTYTQYKIKDVDNIWVYLFFVSIILMQFIEFLIWRNIKSPMYNQIFTTLANILLLVQPIATNMLITNKFVQQTLLLIYLIFMIPFSIYKFATTKIYSSVSSLGHLQWNMILNNSVQDNLIAVLWLFFFLFPLFYQRYTFGFLFGVLTLLIMLYNYSKDKTASSMWCWIVNSIMIYYAIYLLLYLPFFK